MKMDDTVIHSDVIESALKELLRQDVFSNHETSHGFDSFFRNPEISSPNDSASKKESLEQPTGEHPSKTTNIQTLKTTRLKETSNHLVPLELKQIP